MLTAMTLPAPAAPDLSADRSPLDRLPKGSVARIVAIDTHDAFGNNNRQVTQRLKELGFLPGAKLRVIGFGLFGRDPIAVHINGTKFALRRAEASKIITEIIDAD